MNTVQPVRENFELLVDLGIVVVSKNYEHASQLASFKKVNHGNFVACHSNITDENFAKPTMQLVPGSRLHVRAFKQIVSGPTTSEERMAFLSTQKAIYVGAQGASLVFEQKRAELPKGYWYVSFDKKEALWIDGIGYYRVPGIRADPDDVFIFDLLSFQKQSGKCDAILCFSDEAL
jgi:hypothetical protein